MIRKIATFLIATLMAIAVAPASAQTKIFSAAVPTTIGIGMNVAPVTFYNETPSGNSTINSVKVNAPTGITITGLAPGSPGAVLSKDSGGAWITINSFTGIRPGKSLTFFLSISYSDSICGTGPLTWPTPLANAGNSLQGDNFYPLNGSPPMNTLSPRWNTTSAVQCDGTIACGTTIPVSSTIGTATLTPADPGYAEGRRGWFNGKGELCNPVAYDFTNNLLVDDSAQNKWNVSQQPSASFYYVLNSKLQTSPNGVAPTINAPKVAWQFDSSGNPINILDALICLTGQLPQPYGRLPAAGLAQGALVVTLDLTSESSVAGGGWQDPPAKNVTFPLYINSERIDAKWVNDGDYVAGTSLTLQLVRGRASTQDATHTGSTTTVPNYALSTPLPIDTRSTSPYVNHAVQACVVSQGWQTYGGTGQYFEQVDVIDIGDAYFSFE